MWWEGDTQHCAPQLFPYQGTEMRETPIPAGCAPRSVAKKHFGREKFLMLAG